ncbi:MAG TPA: STAS domain-containing protein [Terriglobales bacterium]
MVQSGYGTERLPGVTRCNEIETDSEYHWGIVEHHPTQQVQVETVADTRADVRIIKVHGPLTIHNFFEFQDIARKQPAPRVLLIDLTDVPYVDSAVLGSFVGVHVSCEQAGRKYALINVNEHLKALFSMTGLGQFLVTRETIADAEAEFSEQS